VTNFAEPGHLGSDQAERTLKNSPCSHSLEKGIRKVNDIAGFPPGDCGNDLFSVIPEVVCRASTKASMDSRQGIAGMTSRFKLCSFAELSPCLLACINK